MAKTITPGATVKTRSKSPDSTPAIPTAETEKQSPPSDDWLDDMSVNNFRDRTYEAFRIKYKKTGNPIYVWRVIEGCAYNGISEFIDSAKNMSEKEYKAAVETKMIAGEWPPPPSKIPDWCLRYLSDVALKIRHLDMGLDDRKCPAFSDTEVGTKASEKWKKTPTLTPRQATQRLPWALGFVRRTWNAFSETLRLEKTHRIIDTYSDLQRECNLSPKEAKGIILEKLKREDDRQLRRILNSKI